MCGEATAGNGSGTMAIQRRRDERGEAASEHGLGRAVTGEEGKGGGRSRRGCRDVAVGREEEDEDEATTKRMQAGGVVRGGGLRRGPRRWQARSIQAAGVGV